MNRLYLLLMLVALSGCSAGHWLDADARYTEFRINPLTKTISFYDSKDNDVLMEGFEVNTKEGTAKLAKLQIVNKASDAIVAEVERMKAVGDAQMSQVAYLHEMMSGLSSIADALAKLANSLSWLVPAPSPPTATAISLPTPLGLAEISRQPVSPPAAPTKSNLPAEEPQ